MTENKYKINSTILYFSDKNSIGQIERKIYKHHNQTISAPSSPLPSQPRPLQNVFVNVYKDIDRPEPIHLRDTTDDELFLLIDDQGNSCVPPDTDAPYASDQDSGIVHHHMEYRQHALTKKCNVRDAAAAATVQLLPKKLQETPKKNNAQKRFRRRCRTKTDFAHLRSHSLSRATQIEKSHFSKQQRQQRYDAIELEIAKRMADMGQLLQYEDDVTVELARKCAQYRAQNDRYNDAGSVVGMCVERVQAKLEQYSNAIVQNELELFKVKLEITQKCGVLHNLQRMLKMEQGNRGELMHDDNYEQFYSHPMRINPVAVDADKNDENVHFVDNIYEFCDNNKSIIV